MVSFIKNILQLVLSPSSGWEDISVENPDPKYVGQKCMLPLFGLASISVFMQGYYHPELSMAYLIVKMAAIFASFFAGYVVTESIFKMLADSWIGLEADSRKCSIMVIFAYSLMALAMLVCNVLPLTLGLPYLLPLGVGIIIWKSMSYVGVKKEREFNFMSMMVLVVLILPALIRVMFDWVME